MQSSKEKNKGKGQEEITSTPSSTAVRISVTGFTGHERTAAIQPIQASGATYDDSMRQHITTHLICADSIVKSQQNQKFQKAQEWGIHVVSVDWLYHVLQHGGGKKKDEQGDHESDKLNANYSESLFSMAPCANKAAKGENEIDKT
jgi:hypothetical protein